MQSRRDGGEQKLQEAAEGESIFAFICPTTTDIVCCYPVVVTSTWIDEETRATDMLLYRSMVGANCPSCSVVLAATRRCCAQVADTACGSTSDEEGITQASIDEAQGARPAAVEAWIEYKKAAQSMKEVGGESLRQSSYAQRSSPVYAAEVQARAYK